MSVSSYKLNVSVAVSDMARAWAFYEGKLGLSTARTGADGSQVYSSGGDTALRRDHRRAVPQVRPNRPPNPTTQGDANLASGRRGRTSVSNVGSETDHEGTLAG